VPEPHVGIEREKQPAGDDDHSRHRGQRPAQVTDTRPQPQIIDAQLRHRPADHRGRHAGDRHLADALETANPGHKVWFIGDIGDMTPIDKNHVFLSSVLWNFTGVFTQAIKDVNAGTYGTHGYDLSLKNGGISLLHSKYIPASTWTQIQAVTPAARSAPKVSGAPSAIRMPW